MVNSANPDHSAASDQGLHCLAKTLLFSAVLGMCFAIITDPYSYAHKPDKDTVMSSQTEATADTTGGNKNEEKKETSETITTTVTVTDKQIDNKSMKKVRSKKG